MEFSVNHPILFIIVGAIIALVLAQSVYFLVRALKRARQLGIEKSTLGKIISSAAIFTIAPAVAIEPSIKSIVVAIWRNLPTVSSARAAFGRSNKNRSDGLFLHLTCGVNAHIRLSMLRTRFLV